MTQQSLITRLKAVEEALEYAEHRLASSQPDAARDIRTHISEPLSNLRELIKEAEGQVAVGEVRVEFNDDSFNGYCRRFFGALRGAEHKVGAMLYTALGEKP